MLHLSATCWSLPCIRCILHIPGVWLWPPQTSGSPPGEVTDRIQRVVARRDAPWQAGNMRVMPGGSRNSMGLLTLQELRIGSKKLHKCEKLNGEVVAIPWASHHTWHPKMGRVQHGYCTACQLVLPGRNFGPSMLQQTSHLWRCLRCEEVCSCIHCGNALPLSSFKLSEQHKPREEILPETDISREVISPARFGAAQALALWRLVISRLCDRLPAEVLPKLLRFLDVPTPTARARGLNRGLLGLGSEVLCFRCDRILSAGSARCPCEGFSRRSKPRWRQPGKRTASTDARKNRSDASSQLSPKRCHPLVMEVIPIRLAHQITMPPMVAYTSKVILQDDRMQQRLVICHRHCLDSDRRNVWLQRQRLQRNVHRFTGAASAAMAKVEKNMKEASRASGVNVSLIDRVVRKHREEQRKAHSEVQEFLKINGFNSGKVNELKGFLSRTSPLHEAVKQKNASMVAALLQLGADSDFRDFPMGRTAFEYAERSERSSAELTQIFRQCGCAPDSYQFCKTRQLTQAPRGFEAFFAEKEKDQPELFEALLGERSSMGF
eukprot:s2531_g13.t1